MSKQEHIFPKPDEDFDKYEGEAVPYIIGNAVRLMVSAGDITDITNFDAKWGPIWKQSNDPTQRTPAVVKSKNDLRQAIEAKLRAIFGDIPQSLLTSDDRLVLHLKARDTENTRVQPMEVAPVQTLKSNIHLQHKLHFHNPDTPKSNAMPEGQHIILESFVGAVGLNDKDIVFGNAKTVTKAETTISFTDVQVGQMCYYRSSYESTHSERGPWSDTLKVAVG